MTAPATGPRWARPMSPNPTRHEFFVELAAVDARADRVPC